MLQNMKGSRLTNCLQNQEEAETFAEAGPEVQGKEH